MATTLEDLLVDQRCRKGRSAGIDELGAYWRPCEPIKLRLAGGDGVGNNGPAVTFWLEFRHYRSAGVHAFIRRDSWHQNRGEYIDYQDMDQVLGETTIEGVVVRLLQTRYVGGQFDPDNLEKVYSERYYDDVMVALSALGLPEFPRSPDEEEEA